MCSQQFGVDYNETFSPILRYSNIRMIFALAAEKELYRRYIYSLFNNSFGKEVYMKQPDGFVDTSHPDRVLNLKKAIYGHKQSDRSWYTTLDAKIQNMAFKPYESEPMNL